MSKINQTKLGNQTTGEVIKRLVTCSDVGTVRIVARLEDEAYWKRFHHSVASDACERSRKARARVSLPQLSFLAD